MAQAECITTAIRGLMSRGRPPKSTGPARAAHTYADGDSGDPDGRTDHLKKAFAALHVYLTAVIADTAQNIRGGTLDRHYPENLFEDLSADALWVIRNAAEEMREHENRRAS